MAFDYKREYREFYLPPAAPQLVDVPTMRFAAVRGEGDPNEPDGAYQRAIAVLYAVAYTVKMSKLGDHRIDGYFDFVVPPLEGFWRQGDGHGIDYARKADFRWIALLRLPEFVTAAEFAWAVQEAAHKKGLDCSPAELLTYDEGLCVQCMHVGSYDDEPATLRRMEDFAAAEGCEIDITAERHHHEIYRSDPRRVAPEKRKTVLRLPVKRR